MTYFLKQKSDALTAFKQYRAYVWTQRHKEIKALRVDNAKEYTEGNFRQYLRQEGIRLETTAPHSPAQNGVAERLNRTLVEHARAMLLEKQLPYHLWEEAIAYATYIKNRMPTRGTIDYRVPDDLFWG